MMKRHARQQTRTDPQRASGAKASGFVLLTALILVLILTILALAGVALNSTQTRVAANTASQDVAFQAAEGALNQGQANLLNGNYTQSGFNANTNGLYLFNQSTAPIWTTVNWSSSSGAIPVSNWGSLASGVKAYYIIEQLPPVAIPGQSFKTPAKVYRITAYATQASGGSPVMLQSLVQVQQ
jgi:type IV pilus assembly protein PilX